MPFFFLSLFFPFGSAFPSGMCGIPRLKMGKRVKKEKERSNGGQDGDVGCGAERGGGFGEYTRSRRCLRI
ncbi:hypothetical protein IHE45_20G020300 [Dioscorea alata]|uniref:Uncharacterized protein n=1 Tax=Dioscorea alata TaxID=55571 RepID=A0ACB7TVK6_DIOAL|nr:hypothetical protein IHE45_20G020300 [Dioscorea alata]